MPSFYQDRLGTNIGKTQKQTVSQAGQPRCPWPATAIGIAMCSRMATTTARTPVRKTPCIFIYSTFLINPAIILPRQARDQHIGKVGGHGDAAGYYMASQIFRYAVTRSKEAFEKSWRALRAMEFLVRKRYFCAIYR